MRVVGSGIRRGRRHSRSHWGRASGRASGRRQIGRLRLRERAGKRGGRSWSIRTPDSNTAEAVVVRTAQGRCQSWRLDNIFSTAHWKLVCRTDRRRQRWGLSTSGSIMTGSHPASQLFSSSSQSQREEKTPAGHRRGTGAPIHIGSRIQGRGAITLIKSPSPLSRAYDR